MKRIHITESIRKIASSETETSPKELAGLHGLVSQVAFGLLLAIYNREKPIQSFDVPLSGPYLAANTWGGRRNLRDVYTSCTRART